MSVSAKSIASLIIAVVAATLSAAGCGDDPVSFELGKGGVYKQEAASDTWNEAGLSGMSVLFLGINPQRPQRLYAGSNDGLHLSENGGNTWRSALHAPSRTRRVGTGSRSATVRCPLYRNYQGCIQIRKRWCYLDQGRSIGERDLVSGH